MSEPHQNADFLDNWIKTQALKYAFNEKTKGFVGKKIIRERLISTIPREFIARGITKDRVGLRLTEMLASDLTQALVLECDEKRIKSNEFDSNALAASGSSHYNLYGSDGGLQNGKEPKTPTVDAEVKGDIHRGVEVSTTASSPVLSVANVDPVIAEFVAGKSSQARPKFSTMHATAQNPNDIFSRGGSSTPASRSPASSIAPVVAPPLPSDPEIPSLPFKQQHRILTALQSILECACYDFARKHYPNLLVRKHWDCPEAGEITQWARNIAFEFRKDPINTKGARDVEVFISTLKSTDEIRNAAVHRIPVTGKDIQRFIESSRAVTSMLGDKRRKREIDRIGGIMETNVRLVSELRREKDDKLRAELEKLEEWKRILELREMRAIRQADQQEEKIEDSFREEIERALDLLETKEDGADVESDGSEKEPGGARSERVENSTPDHQDEEHFHESEIWPVVEVDDSYSVA
ncbi:hypothetical protein DFP73DRAFT_474952 [Morchella snyderi]|nr:hypothetical protein DFP73DRAFT_474952 [Morchella snyderi]